MMMPRPSAELSAGMNYQREGDERGGPRRIFFVLLHSPSIVPRVICKPGPQQPVVSEFGCDFHRRDAELAERRRELMISMKPLRFSALSAALRLETTIKSGHYPTTLRFAFQSDLQ